MRAVGKFQKPVVRTPEHGPQARNLYKAIEKRPGV